MPVKEVSESIEDKLFFVSGGARSHEAPRYDLIPKALLECLAKRFALGVRKKGDHEIMRRYRDGTPAERDAILDDEAWWLEAINHAQEHLIDLRERNFQFDSLWGHCGAIMWNVGMLAWRETELGRRNAKTATSGAHVKKTRSKVPAI